jgi:hypothetical protein
MSNVLLGGVLSYLLIFTTNSFYINKYLLAHKLLLLLLVGIRVFGVHINNSFYYLLSLYIICALLSVSLGLFQLNSALISNEFHVIVHNQYFDANLGWITRNYNDTRVLALCIGLRQAFLCLLKIPVILVTF